MSRYFCSPSARSDRRLRRSHELASRTPFRLEGSARIRNPERSDDAARGNERRADDDDLVERIDRLLVGRPL